MATTTGTIIQNGCCYKAVKVIKNGAEINMGGGGPKYGLIEYLIVGGGGCGGDAIYTTYYRAEAGGGGGGGIVCKGCLTIDSNTNSYPIVVGVMGGGSSGYPSSSSSCAFGITAKGGGNGGMGHNAGSAIGTGGGGGAYICCNGNFYRCKGGCACDCKNGYDGTYDQGSITGIHGGGGGGAGSSIYSGYVSKDGGKGIESDITGELKMYGMGGGGGVVYNSSNCRGGYGCCNSGNGGYVRFDCGNKGERGCDAICCGGGGGGGATFCAGTYSGGNGGNGIVVIRYKTLGSGINPNISSGGCKYQCGEYTIHCFTDTSNAQYFYPAFK